MSTRSESARPRPSFRALFALAWPMVVSRSSQVVVGLSDAVMVAGLGEAALAATTAGAFNTYAVLILPMGIVFIVASFSSQLFGQKDLAGARRYGIYGLLVAVATQLVCLVGVFFMPAILGLFPYEPDVRQFMTDYLAIRFLSGGAVVAIEALGSYYGGIGNTRLPMVANMMAMVFNVVGNWMLIGGRWGAPALGVKGAALASAIATYLALAFILYRFWADGRRVAGKPALSLREWMRMLKFGLPSGFNWFFEFFAFNFFINVVVAGLGTTALAAMMAVFQINSVAFMPAFGLASAGAILVGQAIGAGAKDEVPRVVRLTFTAAGTWQGLIGVSYLLFPGALLLAFTSAGASGDGFREVATRMLMLSAAWQLFDAAANSMAESLRAAGDTAYTLWARLVIAWAIFVPGSYFTVRHLGWGDVGVMMWLVSYLAILSLVLFLRFRSGAWRRIQLTEPPSVIP